AAAVAEADEATVAAVRKLVEDAAATSRDFHGLDDVERGGELDKAGTIAGRQGEVDDGRQAWLGRVDRGGGVAGQGLVGPGVAEGDATGEGLPALDVEPNLVAFHHEPPVHRRGPRRPPPSLPQVRIATA